MEGGWRWVEVSERWVEGRCKVKITHKLFNFYKKWNAVFLLDYKNAPPPQRGTSTEIKVLLKVMCSLKLIVNFLLKT